MRRKQLAAAGIALAMLCAGTAQAGVWFEDQFDGDALSDAWELRNEEPDSWLVEDGKLIMIAPDKQDVGFEVSRNVLVLKEPVPKGDWTMTVGFNMPPQAMGEELDIGVATDGDNLLVARFYYHSDNYARSIAYVEGRKVAKGQEARFWRGLYTIESRDLELRAQAWTDNIAGAELRLEKRGRKYTAMARLIPAEGASSPPSDEWFTVQKLTSLRSPGKNFTLFFGSNSSSYVDAGGEGLIEIDWVRIETPD